MLTITPDIEAQKNGCIIIDVREPIEYATEHIPGALSHPLSTFNPNQIELRPGQRLVLYCPTDKRSTRAAELLKSSELTNLTTLQNGLSAWKTAGCSVEKIQGAPISLFRQVQIVAGTLVVLGILLGLTVSPWGLLLSGFVSAGLVFAGLTNTCAMGMLLAQLPYNRCANQR